MSYGTDDLQLTSERRVKLIAEFLDLKASVAEIMALKKVCHELKNVPVRVLLDKLKLRSQWNVGEYFESEAREIVKKASSMGLAIIEREIS